MDLVKVALAGWNEGLRPESALEIPFDEKLLAVAVDEARRVGYRSRAMPKTLPAVTSQLERASTQSSTECSFQTKISTQ